MPDDIKRHKVCQFGYQKNRIDLNNLSKAFKIICQEKLNKKKQKTEIAIFHLYFQVDSFETFNSNVLALPEVPGT